MKSLVSVAFPCTVATEIFPEVAAAGTAVAIDVLVAPLTCAGVALNVTTFWLAMVWKFVPEMVTDVATTPCVGETLVIVGAAEALTVKALALVAEPDGVVTPIVPVVAPEGTLVTISVVVEEVTVAAVPLKVTVF